MQRAAEGAAATHCRGRGKPGAPARRPGPAYRRPEQGIGSAEEQLRGLGAAAEEADAATPASWSARPGRSWSNALLRVRETAQQAAERAREAIAEVIPQSAAALADASREALTEAVSGAVDRAAGDARPSWPNARSPPRAARPIG